MIEIAPGLRLPEDALHFEFLRAPGPGGQHVNRTESAVRLRLDTLACTHLPPDALDRLVKLAGARLTQEGEILIEASRFRSREQNREDALARLTALLQRALIAPKKRKKTRPSAAARRQRLEGKKQRGQIKTARRRPALDD
jgi:ribosome-associated protein